MTIVNYDVSVTFIEFNRDYKFNFIDEGTA